MNGVYSVTVLLLFRFFFWFPAKMNKLVLFYHTIGRERLLKPDAPYAIIN